MMAGERDDGPPYGTPILGSISIAGTTTEPDDAAHAKALADFKAWLRQRHPGAKVSVRCRWRPEEYGRVKITLTPSEPLIVRPGFGPVSAQETKLHIERGLIERIWRARVGAGF